MSTPSPENAVIPEENKEEQKASDIQFLDLVPQEKFNDNYANLLRLIVRYGERPLYTLADGSTISVGDYILQQLRADNIQAPTPLYQRMVDEFAAHHTATGFQASQFFKFHQDPEISTLAIELIADKYQLSSIFSKQNISENVTQTVKLRTEEDELPMLIPRLLLELKYTILEQRIDEMERALREAERSGNWEMQRLLLADQPRLLEIRNQICRQLGNRVITS